MLHEKVAPVLCRVRIALKPFSKHVVRFAFLDYLGRQSQLLLTGDAKGLLFGKRNINRSMRSVSHCSDFLLQYFIGERDAEKVLVRGIGVAVKVSGSNVGMTLLGFAEVRESEFGKRDHLL